MKNYFAGTKGILDNLERAKRYLKIGYPQHCVDHSTCTSHCISFDLSNTTDPNLCKERQCGFENHNSFCDQCSNLYSTIDQIIDLVKESQLKNKDDLLYDTSNAKNNILKWTFHIICHVQQNKAKTNVFDLLSETTGLWIRDYCQKVLPIEFRESQSSYFGKKGMTLHCDVFLLKENGTVKKHTYFTTAYRSDQDIKDSLSLRDYVVKEFSKDFPDVKELYCKSDNAGCYHGNPYPESIYKICKQNSITLKRLDYNEPQKGKDQCDRDSALARNALRRYVDEGNDVASAEDIYKALLASPITNAKVSEVQFDKSLFGVNGDSIQKISYYHSFEFTEAGIKVWRYYGIGAGILVPYSIKWSFTSGLRIIKPFKDCLQISSRHSQNKPRASRQLCSLLFCEEGGCTETFKSLAELKSINYWVFTHSLK